MHGTSYETRYPNSSNNPNEAEDEATGCEGLGFGSEGLDAEKLLAEIDAEKARVEKEIASVGAEIDEIARLLATAELGLTAAMEGGEFGDAEVEGSNPRRGGRGRRRFVGGRKGKRRRTRRRMRRDAG